MRGKAFTLVELLTVIAIISILIAVGSYAFSSTLKRNRDATRKSDLNRLANILEQYYLANREYPFVFSPSQFTRKNGSQKGDKMSIFLAQYQLQDKLNCSNQEVIINPAAKRLLPDFIPALPEDPLSKTKIELDSNNLVTNCVELLKNQKSRYLYISAPSTEDNPTIPAKGFGLLATLERPNAQDLLPYSQNPLNRDNKTSLFGQWYQPPPGIPDIDVFDAYNYMVSNTSRIRVPLNGEGETGNDTIEP